MLDLYVFLCVYLGIKKGNKTNMKEWNFTFSDDNDWGWNSVYARGLKSATNKADKWVKKNFPSNKLNEGSVNCNPSTYDMLMRSFY